MGNCWGSQAAAVPQTHSFSSSSTTKATPPLSSATLTTTIFSSSGLSYAPSSSSSIGGGSSSISAAAAASSGGGGHILASSHLRIFTLSQLKSATRNFRSDTLLGEGGFGKVFKGWLHDDHHNKSPIAVKKLNSESVQGFQEWLAEVNFLGRLSHPNLVRLLGYCFEDDELLLVYEFVQKGSLENHLFGRASAVQPLPWEIRLKIAIGAARGLAFLHTSDKQVIYRDFKASNILLDGSYTPKISDFGLAKLGPSASQSHLTTRVMGTNGYAAPEYLATGHLYVKSDVYGFGVVLIEILTGLRALDPTRPTGKQQLVDWIKPYLSNKRKLNNTMDSRLEGKYPAKAALQIARLALNCIEAEPKDRPSMREVVETLERIEEAKKSPSQPGRNGPVPHRRDVIRDHQRSAQVR